MRLLLAATALFIAPIAAMAGPDSAKTISKRGLPPRVYTSMPPPGSLPRFTVFLVDDGSCPSGQIKKVTGGWKAQHIPRTAECIAR
jgi:hypothetical protein